MVDQKPAKKSAERRGPDRRQKDVKVAVERRKDLNRRDLRDRRQRSR
ncbi:MAG: hypothetical protein HOD43_13410 [Candidatus Marinimicrobia bacterium]|jgi:hypothetical protein|nr:hypothetical protein [Candidatus Neomarinimicrobiota bacterium]MBT3629768.1 hypothetical protein [Candidatus Neomarinimicrobiota bacterium]MBT3825650.1 hypothetical protein [Candidatus Neomarinimicrobiota bacterium]MBT4132492.1 hypothetical protein [Candidatus Neomarinimicrobiota bacterium]MBT4296791.1 hypothetical protein [Candidatus Neomarinimicrobiota bacterium]